MKKLLLGSICLLVFASSILVVQVSCSKSNAQRTSDNTPIGKILFGRNVAGHYQIWSANYDGSNASAIPISLPQDVYLVDVIESRGVKVSPDGKKLFFIAGQTINNYQQLSVYSCNTDGSNVKLIVQGQGGATEDILAVYQAY